MNPEESAIGAMQRRYRENQVAKMNDQRGKLKPKKMMNDMLRTDMHTLNTDPMKLGYSQAQQRQMKDEAKQEAAVMGAQSATELGRQALGGQAFQQGAFDKAGEAAADLNQAEATVSSGVSELNLQKVENERARTLGQLETERKTRRENAQYWAEYGLQSVQTLAEVIASLK